ncbi:MAG: hypothetical protein AAB525_02055 [Patescibacteria group bacterium]
MNLKESWNRHLLKEQKEKIIVDFRQRFWEKLASILPPLFRKEEACHFKNFGIEEIVKKCPSVIFMLDQREAPYEIWIENQKEVSFAYPHNDIYKKLAEFKSKNDLPTCNVQADSYIIQDKRGKVCLFFDHKETPFVNLKMKDKNGEAIIAKWADLMERYSIEKMVGNFSDIDFSEIGAEDNQAQLILDRDDKMIEKIRLDNLIFSLAQQYKLTNSQYLKLQCLVRKAIETGERINCYDMAKKVSEQKDGCI